MARRSPAEILDELNRLQTTSRNDRDRLALIQEISVYQEELIVQNEELVRTQSSLEEARDRFIELYEFAPTGYLTLNEHGVILQCNLTTLSLLGRPRDAVEGMPLAGFVMPEDRSNYAALIRRCRNMKHASNIECELTMRTPDGARVFQLLCRHRHPSGKGREYLTSLLDVTERRTLDMERARVEHERATLAARLIEAQDDERKRIAQHLHDDIGQQHTAIRMKLEALLDQTTDESARHLVADLRQMFSRLDQRVHFVATELRPSALDLGLLMAIGQFAREWAETFDVPVSFLSHVPAQSRFPPDVETHLYRIAQEALNNVAKHAAAQHVSVVIDVRDGEIVLVVEDNGRGFDLVGVDLAQTSLGLVGMRERAQLVGGRIHIESTRGQGTSVFVHVPLHRTHP